MNKFDELFVAAESKDLEVVISLYGNGASQYLQVEVRKVDKKNIQVIDKERVQKKNDTPEKAAARLHDRLTRERLL
jgi:hypothetical protein